MSPIRGKEEKLLCNCRKDVEKGILEKQGIDGKIVNYELLTGRTFNSLEYKDGKRTKRIMVLHTYCPTCGKKFDPLPEIEGE